MSKRSKYPAEKKFEIIKEYENKIYSIKEITFIYKISTTTLKKWIYDYQKQGAEGLKESKTWKRYSKELKEQAVIDYISGACSLSNIVRKYEISSTSVLKKWINKYNGHRELTAKEKGMSLSMTKGRKTSLKERIEIVQYCIAHKTDYKKAVEKYHISYQQVYQWVKKYEAVGEDALKDKRGTKKDETKPGPISCLANPSVLSPRRRMAESATKLNRL